MDPVSLYTRNSVMLSELYLKLIGLTAPDDKY